MVSHPNIPGLTYQQDLGSGGFADVYLYRRQIPDRLVAIKVLRTSSMDDELAQRFTRQANLMAALAHPHIAKIYVAGITDQHPYIEMAYYPNGSLQDQISKQPLSVPDVMRFGVQLCSAIQTAHDLNPPLLHRNIKPANVLLDEYNDPVLTDFGIATRVSDQNQNDASSVYWAAPEVMFPTAPIDQRSDVYSLGALLYHLLAGRAPFVIPGGDNHPDATMTRTRDLAVPSIGRPDVPTSLERLLAITMSKNPRFRPINATDLARALQTIEQQQYGFAQVTPFKIKTTQTKPAPAAAPTNAYERTQYRPTPQNPATLIGATPQPDGATIIKAPTHNPEPSGIDDNAGFVRQTTPSDPGTDPGEPRQQAHQPKPLTTSRLQLLADAATEDEQLVQQPPQTSHPATENSTEIGVQYTAIDESVTHETTTAMGTKNKPNVVGLVIAIVGVIIIALITVVIIVTNAATPVRTPSTTNPPTITATTRPAASATQSMPVTPGPTGLPLEVGVCLTVSPGELSVAPPDDWMWMTVDCSSPDASVKLVSVNSTCPENQGCMSFKSIVSMSTYQVNALPVEGVCFPGYTSNNYEVGWAFVWSRCDNFKRDPMLDTDEIRQSIIKQFKVKASSVKPAVFKIEKIGTTRAACTRSQEAWTNVVLDGKAYVLCITRNP